VTRIRKTGRWDTGGCRRCLVLGLLLATPAWVQAWGVGHNSQADQVRRRLPEAFASRYGDDRWERFVNHYSHYPDLYRAESLPQPVGEYFLKTVRAESFNPHDVTRVMPHFVRELRARHDEEALMWAGCLTHSIGDKYALNHPDVIWYPHVTLGYVGVTYTGGRSLESALMPDAAFRDTYFDPACQGVYDEALGDYRGQVIAGDPTEVLRYLVVQSAESLEELNTWPEVQEAFELQERTLAPDGAQARAALTPTLAAIAARGTRAVLDALVTGLALAAQAEEPRFDQEAAAARAQADLEARDPRTPPARSMNILRRLWVDDAPPGALGVLVSNRPGAVYCGGCALGGKHQWTVSMVLRTLAAKGVAYRCVPYEDRVLGEGFDVKQTPVMLVAAPALGSERGVDVALFNRAMEAYLRAGGSVVWLGGRVLDSLAARMPQHVMPERPVAFPAATEEMLGARFLWALGDREFVAGKPLDKMPWNGFADCRCLYFDPWEPAEGTTALLRLVTDKRDVVVGVSAVTAEGGRLTYLPWFALCPCMLTERTTVESVVNLALDEAGEALLTGSLALHRPPAAPGP